MAESVELKGRAFDWYLAHPLATLRDVAIEFEIPYETVREWAKEGWVNRRTIKENVSDDKVIAQASGIRDVLYEEIIEGTRSDLVELVKAWKSIIDIKPPKQDEEFYDRDSILE